MPPKRSWRLSEDGMPSVRARARSLILLLESLVHRPPKESGDQVNNQDNKVDAFDLLFVDYPQDVAEGGFLAKDADKVARFEYQDCGEPNQSKAQKDNRNSFSRTGVHLSQS